MDVTSLPLFLTLFKNILRCGVHVWVRVLSQLHFEKSAAEVQPQRYAFGLAFKEEEEDYLKKKTKKTAVITGRRKYEEDSASAVNQKVQSKSVSQDKW